MTSQPALFDPNTTTSRACSVPGCGAHRLPHQTGFVPTCRHDLDRDTTKRNPQCLNHYRNRPEDPIPF